jgi:tetratricopeptide (TPR) repeat protein
MMTAQPRRRSPHRVLAAAVLAALPLTLVAAPSARAQQQVNTNGTALDANNRIGSNGMNTFRPPPQAGVLGNQIVNGNVTNGRQFHGRVGYSDPTEFAGFQAGRAVSNFEKNSVGVGVPYSPTQVPNQSTPYYAENRFAAPAAPGKWATAPNSAGYIPAQPIVIQPNDPRLGVHLDAEEVQGAMPKPGELVLPGPIDPTSNQRTVFTASPLMGVRPWNSADVNTLQYLSQFTGMRADNVLDRMKLDQTDLSRMRQELQTSSGVALGSTSTLTKGPANAPEGANPAQANGALSAAVGQPLEAPANVLLSGSPVTGSVGSAQPLGGNLNTSETFYNRVLGAPERQSGQYNELKKRLARYENEHQDAGQAAAEAFNKAKRAKEAAAQKNNPTGPVPPPAPQAPAPKEKPAEAKAPPVNIKTMTQGVQAAGLKDLLGKAETLMKEGKFTTAIDTYAAAEQVAPNQPLIWIGRANAELGAAYYGRAEAHLKQAFDADHALLMGQYDLRSFLGEDRLTSVIKDLRDIADTDTKSATPVFLLAYISYNTGNEARAAAYLDLADKRSGGKDPIYKLLRAHWMLPANINK